MRQQSVNTNDDLPHFRVTLQSYKGHLFAQLRGLKVRERCTSLTRDDVARSKAIVALQEKLNIGIFC